ncbi:MAG TPA: CHAD domain-containing protein [Candidatus Limnocylindria bacterium]|jgi:CHAD domain-containing protein|nr:CHAD domain-containing protein [Candidatus Limnocylindria bacterium]
MKPGKPATSPEAIHELRVALKRSRAVLRLIRPYLSKQSFAGEDATLRAIAKKLAPHRDAEVIQKTLERALEDCDADVRRQMHGRVSTLADPKKDPAEKGAAKAAVNALRRFLVQREIRPGAPEPDFKMFRWGACESYRKARKKLKRAFKTRSAADFHACRKWCSRLFLQLQVLEEFVPSKMAKRIPDYDAFQKELGKHHDLHLAKSAMAANAPKADEAYSLGQVLRSLDSRAERSERRARRDRGLFAASPRSFFSSLG